MSREAPLVSVLMTAYNREKYIAEAIESVLSSTFADFELIIVDDRSTDRTAEIAQSYCSDDRVQLHANEVNLGDYSNRNRAASLARGRYLKYLDSDDIIYPYGLEAMVQCMERFPDAALGVERPPMADTAYPIQVSPKQAYCEHFEGGFLLCGPTGAIMRTTAFRQLGGFSGKRFIGDTEMWLKLAARYPVVKLPQGLVWWRRHDGQEYALGHTSFSYAEWNYKISLAALIEDSPFDPVEKDILIRRYKQGHGRILLHMAILQRRPHIAIRIMRKEGFSFRDLLLSLRPGRIGRD